MIHDWGICWETVVKWMPQDLSDDKSTLVQVTAWCRQVRSHSLSQCWLRFMSPYSVTRPRWDKNAENGINLRYHLIRKAIGTLFFIMSIRIQTASFTYYRNIHILLISIISRRNNVFHPFHSKVKSMGFNMPNKAHQSKVFPRQIVPVKNGCYA